MAYRRKVPPAVEAEVLTRSRRRCCICVALAADSDLKKGQIAHLDKDPSNNSEDNLAFLCMSHHDQYDSRTSVSKNFTIEEVKRYRAELYLWSSSRSPRVENTDAADPERESSREDAEHDERDVRISIKSYIKALEGGSHDIRLHDVAQDLHLPEGMVREHFKATAIELGYLIKDEGHLLISIERPRPRRRKRFRTIR